MTSAYKYLLEQGFLPYEIKKSYIKRGAKVYHIYELMDNYNYYLKKRKNKFASNFNTKLMTEDEMLDLGVGIGEMDKLKKQIFNIK